jgi:hypothetical protein
MQRRVPGDEMAIALLIEMVGREPQERSHVDPSLTSKCGTECGTDFQAYI